MQARLAELSNRQMRRDIQHKADQDPMTSKNHLHKVRRSSDTDLDPFLLVFQNHPVPMWVYDLDTLAFLEVNDAAVVKYGYTRDEFLARTIKDIRPDEDVARLEEDVASARPALQHSGEWRHRLKDGHVIDVDITSHTLEFDGRHAALVTANDISERKRTEEAMRQLVLNIPFGAHLYVLEPDQRLVFIGANKAADLILGVENQQFVGKTIEEAFPALRHTEIPDIYRRVAITGERYDNEQVDYDHGGIRGAFEVHAFQTVPNHVAALFTEITERKRADMTLREREQQYRTLVEQIPAIVYMDDATAQPGHTIYVSPQLETILGIKTEEWMEGDLTSWAKHTHPEDYANVLEAYMRCYNLGEPFNAEYRMFAADGRMVWIHDQAALLRDDKGQPRYIHGVMHDITDRKRAEMVREVLLEVIQGVVVTTDLVDFLRMVHESVGKVIFAENFFVALYDKKSNLFEEVYTVDLFDPPSPPSRMEKSVSAFVFRTSQPLLLQSPKVFEEFLALNDVELVGTNPKSWLGVPLKTSRETIGVMVLQDYEFPNRYSERDMDLLYSIAGQIGLAVERKQAEIALRESETSLREAQTIAGLGNYVLDITNSSWVSSDVLDQVLGIGDDYERTVDGWAMLIHPDDREMMIDYFTRHVVGKGMPFDKEYRILRHKDQETRWVTGLGKLEYDEQGHPVIMRGTIQDITERKLAELSLYEKIAALRSLAEIDREIIASTQVGPTLELVCRRAAELLRVPVATIAIRSLATETQIAASYGLDRPDLAKAEINQLLRAGLEGSLQAGGAWVMSEISADDPRMPGFQTRLNIHAGVLVSLRTSHDAIGVLAIFDRVPHLWKPDEVELLELLAGQTALALEKARLFSETGQRLAELEALHTVSAALRMVQTSDEALPILLDETLLVFGTDSGVIWLYEPDQDELRVAVARGWAQQVFETPLKPGEDFAGTVFVKGKTLVSEEFAHEPQRRGVMRTQVPANWGGVSLPIRSGDVTVGVLCVCIPSARQVAIEQVHLLESLAEMGGAALHRMSLYEETTRQLEHLQALHRIDQAISASMDMRVTLGILLEHVATQLKVDATDVLLLNPHTLILEFAAGRGFRTNLSQSARIRLGESLSGRSALERRAMQSDDLALINEHPQFAALWAAEGFVGYYGLPLIAKGQVLGVLEVFQRTPLVSGQAWVDFLEALAGQAVIAIENGQLFERLQRSNFDLAIAYDATIEGWSRALDMRDKETEGHTQRVTDMTERLARAMGLNDAELVHIRRGALLHDIGKMGVPDDILFKPGPLTDDEWNVMRLHPQYAYEMLAPIAYLRPALEIPYCHHEHWDGSGYPRGLSGESIPLAARLFAVVDVWDALCSDRPYRKAWPKDKVKEYIRSLSGTQFDPQALSLFLRTMVD